MTLVKFRPGRNFDIPDTSRTFSSLLDEFFNDSLSRGSAEHMFQPEVDILEEDSRFVIKAYLPGLKKEDIQVSMEGGTLSISGEREQKEEKDSHRFHMKESRYGRFERSFRLPENVDRESIEASYESGVLTVYIEKKEKQVNRQVKIK